ncbi:hypothetical protein D3C73_576730 [compost metagenome]
MATSTAKKKRNKQEREGQRNPELNRLEWNGLNPISRQTPTRLELRNRQMNKHRGKENLNRYPGDDSFLVAV